MIELSSCSMVLDCALIPTKRKIKNASGCHCWQHWAIRAKSVVFPQPPGP